MHGVYRAGAVELDQGEKALPSLGKGGELKSLIYGDGLYNICDEGTYYRVTNQVPGTATAYSITTSFSATSAFAIFRNSNSNRQIFFDYIRLICTTAPASAVAAHYAISVDTTNRYTSGGTALIPQNANTKISLASSALCHIGTPTIAAASANVRYLSRGVLFAAIPVVNSEYVIGFSQAGESTSLGGTIAAQVVKSVGPVILGQGSLLLHLWFPSNASTAPQFEFEAGFWQR